jgi:hypothetical protein
MNTATLVTQYADRVKSWTHLVWLIVLLLFVTGIQYIQGVFITLFVKTYNLIVQRNAARV